jgi:SAM-dependent methyltransferase
MSGDTAERSLAHWSEAGRTGMEAFYALATEDYSQLAAADDWSARLRAHAADGVVTLLDVACGSGKWPAALLKAGLDADLRIEVDLLDPSAFSVAEARAVLAPPFVPAAEHEVGIQDLDPAAGPYDVVWAVHALYAVPPDQLDAGLARMLTAARPGGLGMVAQATGRSHYLRVYEAYRAEREATPFTSADDVVAGLRGLGVEPEVRLLRYPTASADPAVVEGYLQRCLFDDGLSLADMAAAGPLADYLAGCRGPAGWTFEHEVALVTWS